jgi:hypothetical protein
MYNECEAMQIFLVAKNPHKEQWKGEKNAMKVNKTYTQNEKKSQA